MTSSSGEKYRRGEIILVPFPFSDLSSTKIRPALVLVNQEFQDILVCPISSQLDKRDYEPVLNDGDYQGIPMPISSCIRIHHFFCVHESLVRSRVSSLQPEVFEGIMNLIIEYLRPSEKTNS